jgi:hypothetical protein
MILTHHFGVATVGRWARPRNCCIQPAPYRRAIRHRRVQVFRVSALSRPFSAFTSLAAQPPTLSGPSAARYNLQDDAV